MDVPRVGKWYPVALQPPVVPTDPDKYSKYVEAYHLYFRQCQSYGSKHREMLFARDLRQSYGVSLVPHVAAKRDDKGKIIEPAKPATVEPDFRRSQLRAEAKELAPKPKVEAKAEKPKRRKSAAARQRRKLRRLERRAELSKVQAELTRAQALSAVNEWKVVSYKKKAKRPRSKVAKKDKGKGKAPAAPEDSPPSGGPPPSGGGPPPPGDVGPPEPGPSKPSGPTLPSGRPPTPPTRMGPSSADSVPPAPESHVSNLRMPERTVEKLVKLARREVSVQQRNPTLNAAAAAALALAEERRNDRRRGRPGDRTSTGIDLV